MEAYVYLFQVLHRLRERCERLSIAAQAHQPARECPVLDGSRNIAISRAAGTASLSLPVTHSK